MKSIEKTSKGNYEKYCVAQAEVNEENVTGNEGQKLSKKKKKKTQNYTRVWAGGGGEKRFGRKEQVVNPTADCGWGKTADNRDILEEGQGQLGGKTQKRETHGKKRGLLWEKGRKRGEWSARATSVLAKTLGGKDRLDMEGMWIEGK